MAAVNGHIHVVMELLGKGADIDKADKVIHRHSNVHEYGPSYVWEQVNLNRIVTYLLEFNYLY